MTIFTFLTKIKMLTSLPLLNLSSTEFSSLQFYLNIFTIKSLFLYLKCIWVKDIWVCSNTLIETDDMRCNASWSLFHISTSYACACVWTFGACRRPNARAIGERSVWDHAIRLRNSYAPR